MTTWLWIVLGALAVCLFTVAAFCWTLYRMFLTMDEWITETVKQMTYVKSCMKRLQAARERGADVAGLRKRVEALERDIQEMETKKP